MEKDITVLCETFRELKQMKNQDWAEAIVSIWKEVLERSEWEKAEDARFSYGIREISLLGHTRAVLDHALDIANDLEKVHHLWVHVDKDVHVTGCLLHDVDKLLALSPDGKGGCVPTDIGFDYQHGFYSAYYAEKAGFPAEIVTMIINHTAISRMMPTSLEGVILYFADMADAEIIKFAYGQTPSVLKAIGKMPNSRSKMK